MKKTISILIIALIAMVSAATALTVDCDGRGWWNTDHCEDWELQDEFDEVTGDIDQIKASMSTSKGLGNRGVAGLLTGNRSLFNQYNTFEDYADTRYVLQYQLEQAHLEIDYLRASIKLGNEASYLDLEFETAINTCKRTGDVQQVGNYICGCKDRDIALGMACVKQ